MLKGVLFWGLLLGVSSARGNSSVDSIAISKMNMKAYRYFLSKPDSAILLATKAIDLAIKNKFVFQEAFGYFVLSKANWTKANYLLSVVYGYKSLKIYENTDHIFHWGETNLTIARTFIDLKNYEQAKIYLDRTLLLATQHKSKKLLAEFYREKSFLLQKLEQNDSALFYCNEGMKIYETARDTLNISILFGRISRIYLNTGQYGKSLSYCKKTIQLDQKTRNDRGLSIARSTTAEIYYALGKKDSAIYYLKKSIELDREVRNLPNMIRTHQLLATIYEERHDVTQTIQNLKLVGELKDSLTLLSGSGQIQEILLQYEMESKEKIIQLLENEKALQKQKSQNQNLTIGLFGVAIILLGLLSIAFWRMRQFQAKTNQELARRNQSIAAQNDEIHSQSEKLKEVSQLKSKLLSVISHDLRGPINNLQTLLELVTTKRITPEEFREVSMKLKSSLDVSQRTLQNLLNWSLSQMEGLKTQPVPFEINRIIDEVIELTLDNANKKNIKILQKLDGNLSVNADIEQVNLIIRNLTHNALKFSKPDGQVIIITEKQNQFCQIKIEDKGVGMSPAEINLVLTENDFFTRAGTHQEKGTGLGLILCKDFIQRNGGSISIESELGSGTCVTFTLPLA